jgi:ligand-binding sensor domain-containing protein
MRQGDSIVVVTLSLDDEEEDDDDDDVQVSESIPKATMERQSAIHLDYTRYAGEPGPIEVDEKGNMYLAVDNGILLVSSSGSILGKISIPDISIVDMTLGEDRFLYVATESKLFRLRLQNKPLKVPTDLILK